MPTRFRINRPKVIAETIDGEVVIINLDTGTYYSVLGPGAPVWEALIDGASVDEIVTEVEGAFDTAAADARGALEAFVAELVAEELLAELEPGAAGPELDWSAGVGGIFTAPVLERFTDMQELILLDPVHDVEAGEGWPRAKQ